MNVELARQSTAAITRKVRHPFRKTAASPKSLQSTPYTGRERDVIPPGGRLKTRARLLFGRSKAIGGAYVSGHITNNPAVSRKGLIMVLKFAF